MQKDRISFLIVTLLLVAIIAQIFMNRVIALNGFSSLLTYVEVSLAGIFLYVAIAAFGFGVFALVLRIVRKLVSIPQEVALALCGGSVIVLLLGLSLAHSIGPFLPGDLYTWPSYLIYPSLLVAGAFTVGVLFYVLGRVFYLVRSFRIIILIGSLGWILLFAKGIIHTVGLRHSAEAAGSGSVFLGENNKSGNGKVLLLGMDGLDWKILGKLFARGELVTLKRLISQGAAGDIVPVHYDSPVIWTTIATGRGYSDHGVLNFTGFDVPFLQSPLFFYPADEFVFSQTLRYLRRANLIPYEVPARTSDRRVPALWNIISAAGKKVAVINWWPSYPPENVNGYYVSSYALRWSKGSVGVNIEQKGLVLPESLMEVVKSTLFQIKSEYPGESQKNQRDLAWGRITEALLDIDKNLDFVALYLHTPDTGSHGWQKALITTGSASSLEREKWNDLLNSYRLVDKIIGRILTHIDERWTVIIVSDHGWNFHPFFPGHYGIPTPEGVIVISGAQVSSPIPRDLPKSSSFDIAPTVLALLGIPISTQMPGKVIINDLASEVKYVEEYQLGQYWSGKSDQKRSEAGSEISNTEKEFIDQLKALGYIQ